MKLYMYLSSHTGRPIFSQIGTTGREQAIREVLDLSVAEDMTELDWRELLDTMRTMHENVRAGREPLAGIGGAQPSSQDDEVPMSQAPAYRRPEPSKADRDAALAAALDRFAPRDPPPAQGDPDGPLPAHPITDPSDPDAWRAGLDGDGLSF